MLAALVARATGASLTASCGPFSGRALSLPFLPGLPLRLGEAEPVARKRSPRLELSGKRSRSFARSALNGISSRALDGGFPAASAFFLVLEESPLEDRSDGNGNASEEGLRGEEARFFPFGEGAVPGIASAHHTPYEIRDSVSNTKSDFDQLLRFLAPSP